MQSRKCLTSSGLMTTGSLNGFLGIGISSGAQSCLFHFQIIPVVVVSPCRATALPAAHRLDTNDLEMELV